MCGIAGTVGGDRAVVEAMLAAMAHRGPDGEGLVERGNVRLGHRRLAILDLSERGAQPMVSEDGRFAIVHNGEVYNFPALRRELEGLGHRFRSGTDTEVVLRGFAAWGPDLFDRLRGMFAFCVHDEREGEVWLARDPTGIKPLYYARTPSGFYFASEIKAFLFVPDLERRPSRPAVRSALRFACNMERETMLAGVFKVEPGEALRIDGAGELAGRKRYFTFPEARPEARPDDVLVQVLRERLGRVVEGLMISDAPLGAALSGGLDSSGIVALMARTGAVVDTFTVGHGEDDPDLLAARVVAEHCGTRHHERLVAEGDVADLLAPVLWAIEEPLGQMEALQMYLNYGAAAREVKVLLVGEGADECFAGYARYRLLAPSFPLPARARRDLYWRFFMYADRPPSHPVARILSRLLWGPVPPSAMPDPEPRAPLPDLPLDPERMLPAALAWDRATWLHHLSLKRADGTGMAHSLEIRVPFLEREIVEFASTLPAEALLRGGTEKWVLREALRPLLPSEVIDRRKRPFQMRASRGLLDTLEALADRLLDPSSVRARGFFDPARVDRLRRSRPARWRPAIAHKIWSYRVWSLLLCEAWARLFLDRAPSPEAPTRADLGL